MHEAHQEQNDPNETRDYYGELFEYIFYSQSAMILFTLILIAINDDLDGYFSNFYFHPIDWYPPLLTSIVIAAFLGLLWQWITASIPSGAIRVVFWFSPTFTSLLGLLILMAGISSPGNILVAGISYPENILMAGTSSSGNIVAGMILIFFSMILFLYGIWVTPGFGNAAHIMSLSMKFSPPGKIALLLLLIFISIVHTCIYVIGLGRGRITTNIIRDLIFILASFVSQFWTMQVIKNVMLVTVSRVMFMHYTVRARQRNACHEFWNNTVMNCRGSICFGSIVVPIIASIDCLISTLVPLQRQLVASFSSLLASRVIMRVYMLSFVRRRFHLVSWAIRRGNRWGFVQVGVHNKGIVQASMDTWDMLNSNVIKQDLTGSFCFFSGVAVGAICSVVNAAWALVDHKSFDLKILLFSFLIGYYLVQIAMAWPHACVLAYQVASVVNSQAEQSL